MKTAIDFNGNQFNIANMQQSLRIDFPSYKRADVDDSGIPYLHDCIERQSPCGCSVVGNGTLQFPLMVQHCEKHMI